LVEAKIDEALIVKKPFIGEELVVEVSATILNASPPSGGKILPLRR
jgi:hypothetical protein